MKVLASLNDRVLPFYEQHGIPLLRVLSDRGTEYFGKVEQHEFQLYLAGSDIDHTRTPRTCRRMSQFTQGNVSAPTAL